MNYKIAVIVLLTFFAFPIGAEMGGGQHMSDQHRTHMMSQDAMHNMTQMMHRMTDMTQGMTRMMEQSRTMDQK
ncbi:MAG: hypothetical protein OEY67_08290, partial [Gammaproteobacteria bacterium]|nr:hypothetical protein [Gammaproteobacteria bacterium]